MRILVVPVGSDLVASLRDASHAEGTWAMASGVLESAQLRLTRDDPVATLSGPLALLSLSGPAAGPLVVTLGRRGKRGEVEVVGGQLLHARSAGVTAALLDAVAGSRDASAGGTPSAGAAAVGASSPSPGSAAAGASSPSPGIAAARAPSSSAGSPDGAPSSPVAPSAGAARAEPPPAGALRRSWGEIAASVAGAAAGPARPSKVELPRARDRVEHPAFGLCEVLLVRGDRAKVRALRGASRLRELSLSVFEVAPPEDRDGVRVFRLSKRG